GFKELELAGEEFQPAAHLDRYFHLEDLLAETFDLFFGEYNLAWHNLFRSNVFFDTHQQITEEARVKRQRLYDHVDAVAQRIDYHERHAMRMSFMLCAFTKSAGNGLPSKSAIVICGCPCCIARRTSRTG